ncbi:hypothetical protein GCM10018962_85610 [Dactylosporangium matsuzakiense]|uniref:Uncharacterized protein n=1 Tax=Dactylosporangium matsuzakiense TaxID=53360 RepID=A0A9W6KMC5_9ACTN|nr:hypothetical protein GCM10017581_058950 [Dactylosporangium matsuzakiense]
MIGKDGGPITAQHRTPPPAPPAHSPRRPARRPPARDMNTGAHKGNTAHTDTTQTNAVPAPRRKARRPLLAQRLPCTKGTAYKRAPRAEGTSHVNAARRAPRRERAPRT